MNFVDDQGIRWCHLGTDSQHNAWDPMSEDVVVQALGIILDTDNYPLMIMCNLGRHRTGTLPHALLRCRWVRRDAACPHPWSAPRSLARAFCRGRSRAGTVVGCLRKLQRWNLSSIFEEYRRYAGSKVRLLNEQFIELFDTDLVRIPVNKPKFL